MKAITTIELSKLAGKELVQSMAHELEGARQEEDAPVDSRWPARFVSACPKSAPPRWGERFVAPGPKAAPRWGNRFVAAGPKSAPSRD